MEDETLVAQKLINLSAMIINIYKLMAAAEYSGQKESEEYKNLKAKIKGLMAQENDIYEELKDDIKKAYAINNLLFPMGILCLPDELEYIKRQDQEGLIRARVGRRINDVVLTSPFTYEEMEGYQDEDNGDPEENYDDFSAEFLECEDPEEEFKKESELTIAVENDIINTILSMLTGYSNNQEYGDIKEGLTYLKYYLAFLYPEVEKGFLSSNFSSPEFLVWTSYFTGNMQSEPSETVKSLIREYIMDIISNQLDAYYDAADEQEPDIKKLKIAFTEIILRASMIFFDDGEIRDLKELADDDLKNLANEADINNSLNRVFKSRNADSSLPYVLSLHPNFPGN